jgi:hypothetical protein
MGVASTKTAYLVPGAAVLFQVAVNGTWIVLIWAGEVMFTVVSALKAPQPVAATMPTIKPAAISSDDARRVRGRAGNDRVIPDEFLKRFRTTSN